MAFINEVPTIFIQRFYSGWISLRNQLITPVRTMGRRIIELYDALISGNDWEITPKLSLKRRAGHTAYATLSSAAINMVSWKSNTMGTIPVIDTLAAVEFIDTGTAHTITNKTAPGQIGMMGIGNYFYMGNTVPNLKWDGPTGVQGVTNWGISQSPSSTYGPATAGTGTDVAVPSGVAWSNPSNVTGTGGYATVAIPKPFPPLTFIFSDLLQATNFSFTVPANTIISGINVTFNASQSDQSGGNPINWGAINVYIFTTSGGSNTKLVRPPATPTSVSLGGAGDTWGLGGIPQANLSTFGVAIQANAYGTLANTVQVNDVVVTLYSGTSIVGVATGSGTFSAVNGYSYVVAYGNSVSGEISNASIPSASTGPFSSKASVDITVTASTDTQVNQIRVYRTTDTGGGNQFFEIANSPFPNTSATVSDTTPDTSLQVTSQAEINLGNTPPPAGLKNLEWFAGRMWGSTDNLLWASTGPETISGTAPNSNWNPEFQWVIPGVIVRLVTGPNGMLVFTQDDCYIVRGTDIVNYTVNEFVRDFGVRSYNCVDTDGTNLYVFTSDRQLIQMNAAGAQDIGLPIADQLQNVDPSTAYLKVNRYGLDSILRLLDTAQVVN